MTEWLLLGAAVLLTFGTALFVAAEFALVSLDRPAVERAVEAGDVRARGVLAAVRTLSTQLSGAQVGITVTTLVVGYLAEPSVARLVGPPLDGVYAAVGVPGPAREGVSVGIALVLATVLSMVVGELVPKNLAIAEPLRVARVVAGPHRAFTAAVGPLVRLLNGTANRILRAVGVEPVEELSSGRSAPELASLVRRSADAGTLGEQTAVLLTRSLDFSARTAADVMTPRVRLHTLARGDTAEDLVQLARRSGHSRFPVLGEDGADDVAGVVHLKAALAVPRGRRGDVRVGGLAVDPLRVPETIRLDPLLRELRGHGLQLAVVVDEYGGTAGVVTLEDVVEELVGEVADEHDRSRPGILRRRDGGWTVPGLVRPDEVTERTGVALPEGPAYETVGGLVMARLGRVPRVGDEVVLPGALLRVERMDGRRVDRLLLLEPAGEPEPAGERAGGQVP